MPEAAPRMTAGQRRCSVSIASASITPPGIQMVETSAGGTHSRTAPHWARKQARPLLSAARRLPHTRSVGNGRARCAKLGGYKKVEPDTRCLAEGYDKLGSMCPWVTCAKV